MCALGGNRQQAACALAALLSAPYARSTTRSKHQHKHRTCTCHRCCRSHRCKHLKHIKHAPRQPQAPQKARLAQAHEGGRGRQREGEGGRGTAAGQDTGPGRASYGGRARKRARGPDGPQPLPCPLQLSAHRVLRRPSHLLRNLPQHSCLGHTRPLPGHSLRGKLVHELELSSTACRRALAQLGTVFLRRALPSSNLARTSK